MKFSGTCEVFKLFTIILSWYSCGKYLVAALSALSEKPRPCSHENVAKYLTVSRDNIVVAAFSAIVLGSISFSSTWMKIAERKKGRWNGQKNIASKKKGDIERK